MPADRTRPADQWERLRESSVGDGTIEVPSHSSGIETGYGPIRFALGPQAQPRLLVPCGPGALLKRTAAGRNLAVSLARFDVANGSTLFVDILCLEPALDAVFAELAGEVVHRVGAGCGPVDAVEGTITDFRDLLHSGDDREVPYSQILGLVGELLVLRSLVHMSPGAIEAWTGPDEQRHDFRQREHAIEVKTSSRADSTTVAISSCEQLAEPAGGTLILVHVCLERTDNGELSVSTLVTDIVAAGCPRPKLIRVLSGVGCTNPEADLWNRLRFSVERISGYRVVSGFPRITSRLFPRGLLPDGIETVSYTLDLDAARDFRLTEGELENAYARVAS